MPDYVIFGGIIIAVFCIARFALKSGGGFGGC